MACPSRSVDNTDPRTLLVEMMSFLSVWKAHARQHGLFQKHARTVTGIFCAILTKHCACLYTNMYLYTPISLGTCTYMSVFKTVLEHVVMEEHMSRSSGCPVFHQATNIFFKVF